MPKPLVLVLEDEPFIQIDVEATLAEAGFNVIALPSRLQSLVLLDELVPDVAILDVKLRDGSCLDVAERLVEISIPFIVHTGYKPDRLKETVFERGLCLTKPAQPHELTQAVLSVLSWASRG